MLRRLLNYFYPSTQKLPAQVASTFIHGDNVIYGLSYENNGNGSNKVKLLIKPLYPAETYEYDMGFSISDEFKDQVSLTLLKHSPETDKITIVLPEEATNKQGKKYIKGLSVNTYEINLSSISPVVTPLGTTKLQKNINSENLANEGNSYFQPKVTLVEGDAKGGIVVTANNLKEQAAVAWYLKPNKKGEFEALVGTRGTIERNLFKLNYPNSEFALNGNTLLHSQTSKQIVDNHKVETTNIFTFDIAEAVKKIKGGKGIERNKYLLTHDFKTQLVSSKNKTSFLRYMAQSKRFAFLESNTLHIRSLNHIGEEPPFYEFQGPIEQLYIEENERGDITATAVSEGNIIVVRIDHATKKPTHKITPINTIKNLNDFLNIIHDQLSKDVAYSTTVATIAPTSDITTAAKELPTTPITVATSKRTVATTI
ncbi:hypothetical protein IC220_03975, partial [Wolbachia endosymbiont of Pentalonia nigronervosa]|nr:hypothetical protein [Wolbachia endosymbiont of Pentalonia nigronervosa]